MKTLIDKIQNNFDKASTSYDDVADVQRIAANYLIEKVLAENNFHPKHILDLGTGTGYIPYQLMQSFPNSVYYLNDISPNMLDICKKKFFNQPNVIYLNTEMTKINTTIFDLIISNLALQWVDNLWYTLDFFRKKNANLFAFSTLLDGTFQEWENLIHPYEPVKLQKYPSSKELIYFCDKIKGDHNFHYWLVDIPLSFEHPLKFMQYLKKLGASTAQHEIRIGNLKRLLKKQEKTLTVSYKLFFGLFKKSHL